MLFYLRNELQLQKIIEKDGLIEIIMNLNHVTINKYTRK